MENCFMKLSLIHELGEFQRNTLYLAALSVGNAEERKSLDMSKRRGIVESSAGTWSIRKYFGLVFTSHRAAKAPLHGCERRGHHRGILRFILTAVGTATTSLVHQHTGIQIGTTSIRH
jgi:hypothetical protein